MELVPVVNGIEKVIGSSRCGTRTSLHGKGDDSVFTDALEPDGNESFAAVERLLREMEPWPPNFNIERLWLRIAEDVGLSPQRRGQDHRPHEPSAGDEFR